MSSKNTLGKISVWLGKKAANAAGTSAFLLLFVFAFGYAATTYYPDLSGVSSGSPVSSSAWNDVVGYANKAVKQESEVITVNTGKVGIGTPNPGEILSVQGTNVKPVIGGLSHTPMYSTYDSQNNTALEIAASGAEPALGMINLTTGNAAASNNVGAISFATRGTSAAEKRSALIGSKLEADSSSTVNGNLVFMTNNGGTVSEKMRISASGGVGIGITSPVTAYKLHVMSGPSGAIYAESSNAYAVAGSSTSGYGAAGFSTSGWGIWCGSSSCGGSSAWQNMSDARLKTDVAPIGGALEKISRLQGVTYRWKDSERDGREGRKIGLIAQEVEKEFPEIVKTDSSSGSLEGGTKMLSYAELVAPLIEAVKELKTASEKKDAEIAELRKEIEAIKTR